MLGAISKFGDDLVTQSNNPPPNKSTEQVLFSYKYSIKIHIFEASLGAQGSWNVIYTNAKDALFHFE